MNSPDPIGNHAARNSTPRAALQKLLTISREQKDEQRLQAWTVASNFYDMSDTSAAQSELGQIAAQIRPTHPVAARTLIERFQIEEGEHVRRLLRVLDHIRPSPVYSRASHILVGAQLGTGVSLALIYLGAFERSVASVCVAAGMGLVAGVGLTGCMVAQNRAEKSALRTLAATFPTGADAV